MWNVFVFASLLGSGSLMVEVSLSGMGFRAASGTIFSATLEIGSRECVSCTEARPRVKIAGRTAAAECQQCSIADGMVSRGVHTSPPRGQTSKGACASHCVCCVEWRVWDIVEVKVLRSYRFKRQSATHAPSVMTKAISPSVIGWDRRSGEAGYMSSPTPRTHRSTTSTSEPFILRSPSHSNNFTRLHVFVLFCKNDTMEQV